MSETDEASPSRWVRVLVVLSVALFFVTLPHALEDFAAGEPARKGVPAPALALVVSALVAAQAVGLYWLGQRRRRGLWVHAALGVIWPVAAGVAQLPMILGPDPYRAGAISVFYVIGMMVIGPAIAGVAAAALRADRP